MKIIVVIVSIFIASTCFGQAKADTLLRSLKKLDVADNIGRKLLTGHFTKGSGWGGYTYRLDSSGTFERVDFADFGGSHVTAKGTFKLNTKQQVELTTERECLTFNVFVLDTFVFFVRPTQTHEFQTDVAKAVASFGKKPVYKIGDESYSSNYMAAFSLAFTYLVKGID